MKYSWSESFRSPLGLHRPAVERRIADGEVVRPSDVQFRIGKVGPQYVSLGMQQARDLRGRGVEFNAGKAGPVGNALRRQGQE